KLTLKLSCECFQIVKRVSEVVAMNRSAARYFNNTRSPFCIVQRYSDMLASCARETSRTNDVRLFQIEITSRSDDIHFVAFCIPILFALINNKLPKSAIFIGDNDAVPVFQMLSK